MSALWVLLLPLIGALVTSWLGRAARLVAALLLAADAALLIQLWVRPDPRAALPWLASWSADWMPQLGVRFALGIDGLSLLMALMACVVGFAALAGTPSRGRDDGPFCALFLAGVAGVIGVFLATDLALFFICFEVMLLPVFALMIRWGTGDSRRAALRFFVFTQAGGLLMLVAIVGLHVVHFAATGVRTFDHATLLATPLGGGLAMLFLLGFAFAFAVKLPLVPFHTWQAPAYASAPTEAAILLAALMAKTAGFGLIRFALPLFPEAALQLAPWAITLGLVTIIYAAWLAYGQQDIVRVIAYSSASHLGYVVLGVFTMTDLGRTGAIVQMFCHGLSVAGLFLVFAHVERQAGTRELGRLGGLWHAAPHLGGVALLFTLATLGLPGLGNFIGEFMVLAGLFQTHPVAAAVAAIGAVLSAAYALRMVQGTFFGRREASAAIAELPVGTLVVCAGLVVALIWTGLHPQPLVTLTTPTTEVSGDLVVGGRR